MDLRDIFFPRSCLSCKRSGRYLCTQCISKVQKSRETCPACNSYSFGGNVHPPCKFKWGIDGHIAAWKYHGVVRNGVHALKYRFAFDVCQEFINLIDSFPFQSALLIPIPLHTERQNWRGFNQSALLARGLATKFDLPCVENVLIRTKNTTPQAHLGRQERLQNIRGKFAVKDSIFLTNTPIVLIDDVWTTGSTIKECGKVLKKVGVKEVWGWTLAS